MPEPIGIGRTCKNGHVISGKNVLAYLKNGTLYSACKECRKEYFVAGQKAKPSEFKECPVCHEVRKIAPHRNKCSQCRKIQADINKGRMRAPDYTEVNTSNFKEPMQKVEDGFGYYGAITTTNDEQLIQCHVCGYYFARLSSHIMNKHMPVREYKLKFGLRIKDGLLSPVARKEAQMGFNRSARDQRRNLEKMWQRTKQLRAEGKLKTGGPTWTAQTRNEKGMCRDQTLAKLQSVAATNGGKITTKLYEAEYGQGAMETVRYWFGSWEAALQEAGLASHKKLKTEERHARAQSYLLAIKRFHKETGRTPQSSDFNSVEYLPAQRSVSRMFKTLNDARQLAGVPQLMKVGGRWIEVTDD